jgi:lysozyme
MIDRQALVDQIRAHEGTILHAYPDALGYLTIGTGRLIDERKGGGISYNESQFLLANDLVRCEGDLVASLPWWSGLDECRQRALIELRFSLGMAGLLQFRWTLSHLQAKEWEAAAGSLLASRWASQVGPRRAERLAAMLREGR